MYFALGILSAGIVALVLGPPLWRRALRLTRRDMKRTLPMTRAEIALAAAAVTEITGQLRLVENDSSVAMTMTGRESGRKHG